VELVFPNRKNGRRGGWNRGLIEICADWNTRRQLPRNFRPSVQTHPKVRKQTLPPRWFSINTKRDEDLDASQRARLAEGPGTGKCLFQKRVYYRPLFIQPDLK